MNVKIILLCLTYCFAAAICMSVLDTDDTEWKNYKKEFNKSYKTCEEEIRRYANFKNRVIDINRHNERFNKSEVSFKLKITQFSDLSDEEILKKNNHSYIPYDDDDNTIGLTYELTEDQDKITRHCDFDNCDWRNITAFSRIKNMQNCDNADYAFAAAGALEFQLSQKNKNLTELSEQELIDCSTARGNMGCIGGVVTKAIDYVEKNGLSTEKSYPFKGQYNGKCPGNLTQTGIINGTKISCKPIYYGLENTMRSFVSENGPITATIDASPKFRHYSEGIFTDEDCVKNRTNYNVLIVGYGTTNKSEEYWIVKNWWGESWGEKGYAKIAFNKNTCGIASHAKQIKIISDE